MNERTPFAPAEFDAACREIERRHPACWSTSGYRGIVHNVAVGGHARSKHAIRPCMARDYNASTEAGRIALASTARELGLWYENKSHGTALIVHVQGLAPGPIPEHWRKRYLDEGGNDGG